MAKIGWIKIHRKIQENSMYKSLNSKQRDVLMQCLLLANRSKKKWGWGKEVCVCNPGQFITSLENLKNYCGSDVKIQSVRTSLLKLEKWHFLTSKSTKTGRLITICNWDVYQSKKKETNKETNKQLTKSQQLTRNKEVEEVKETNNTIVLNRKKENELSKLKEDEILESIKSNLTRQKEKMLEPKYLLFYFNNFFKCNMTRNSLDQLLKDFSIERIRDNIMRLSISRNKENVKNPIGMLVSSLKKDWVLQEMQS